MKAVFAQYERMKLRRRINAGIAVAKKDGKHLGRKYKLNKIQLKRFLELHRLREDGQVKLKDILSELDISRATYYNLVNDFKAGLITEEKLPIV